MRQETSVVRARRRLSSRAIWGATCCVAIGAGAGSAEGSILGVTIVDASSGDYTLTSVTVDRGAAGIFNYTPAQLIGVDVTDVAATGSGTVAVQHGASLTPPGSRATLLEDGRLDTGLINPFSTGAAADESFEVTFLNPVINHTGADLLVFEFGEGDPTAFWVDGDRVNLREDVADTRFDANLLAGVPFTQFGYSNPAGGSGSTNVTSLAVLEATDGWDGAGQNSSQPVAGIALDLSDFGIAEGASISTLRWQTLSTGSRLDTVLIAGLPAIPEPTTLALIGVAGACMLGRRRSC